ncbi:MAG: DUF4150 domain-containing protein [Polyangiaceae bacterium]|nr:DUF4150 domain-containing protein [Polyangiaceae bacterium]
MAHHVYANDNEICSKTADGKSVMATDTCFSPGAPYPGVPVTYMNMCQASDVTNGSKTVFIMGGEICLEDKSYFATSYGDEPATQALKKGVVSNAVQGKCYFIAWSPNVFAESLAVTRHMDMVTHNHSNPGNTPAVYYISRAAPPKDCVKDIKKMDERCKPDDDKTKVRKGKKLVKKGGDKLGGWVLDHCGPLLVKPGADFKEWMNEFGDLNKLMEQATQTLKNEVIQKLEQEIAEYATKKLVKMAVRRGLTGWIPIVGWALTIADVAYTGYELSQKIPELKEQLSGLKDMAKNLEEAGSKIARTFNDYKDKIKNFDKLSPEEQGKVARELMADVQSAYALANPCLRARKCLLVPFSKTESSPATLAGDACCPGQTGHHLLPDAMFRDPEKTAAARKANPKIDRKDLPLEKCWEGYTEGGAPTICMEGTNNTMGSHGAMHKATETLLTPFKGARQMDYDTAAKLMAKQVALMYGCDADCIKAQLDAYYKDAYKCGALGGAKVVPHTGMAGGGPKVSGGGM